MPMSFKTTNAFRGRRSARTRAPNSLNLINALLLTNVTAVNTATIALWYYWRWQIECFFKLLKQAGHHLESWQQESAAAIAKRLLVVSMACVTVWAIAADKSKEAAELRVFLIKLSGRQMRHKKEFTESCAVGRFVGLSLHA